MAFPASPTESGGAKLHFLTTDGNVAAGWVAVETGTTGTGSNVVGWTGIATHVEGDEVADPGDIATSAAPLVLMGGDDGTTVGPLQLDGNDALKVILQANTGTDIGDVDVTSILPGTGATNLGKIEDAAHASGDVGVMALSVRNDTLAALGGTDGDYAPLQVNATGALFVEISTGTVALSATDNAVLDTIDAVLDTIKLDTQGIETAVEIIDDWDESNRAKVNPIVGQAGIAAGAGAVGATVPRMTLASDDPAVAKLGTIDTDTGTLAGAVSGSEMQVDVVAALPTGSNTIGVVDLGATDNAVLDTIDAVLDTIKVDTEAIETAVELQVYGGGTEAAAQRVTIANDSTGVVTVDGTVTANPASGTIDTVTTVTALTDITGGVVPGVGATDLGKAIQSAQGTADTGVGALAVRNDSLADLAGADGDYTPLQVNASGALYVDIRENSNPITVDAASTSFGAAIEGDVDHDGADANAPVKVGGRAQAQHAAVDEVADDDRVDALFDRNGYQRIRGDVDVKSAVINDATSGNNEIVALASGKHIAVWAVLVVSDGTTDVRFESNADGTALTGQMPLQAREGFTISAGGLVPLFKSAAGENINLELTAAVNVHGFISYTLMDD